MKREETTLPNIEFTTATGNYDESRKPIDRIVIHTTVGTLQSTINRFETRGTKVSAHYIVDLDGKLYQGLEEYYTAYHSGNYEMNQRSIGIEHCDNGKYTEPRTDALYETSSKLVADICKFYNIPCDRQHILKHNEITATGCPHNLDIDRIIRGANEILNPQNYYKGIDLNNLESVKVCIDTWHQVAVENLYLKKEDHERIINEKEATIQNLNQQINQLNATNTTLNNEKTILADKEKVCLNTLKEKEEQYNKLNEELLATRDKIVELEKLKDSWQIKESDYIKQIKTLQTKYQATKSSIKKLLIDYIFGRDKNV